MKSYSTFIFDSYSFDPETGRIELRYGLENDVLFTEILELPLPIPNPQLPATSPTLFALHLAGGASYYKTCCPKTIEVRSGELSEDQAQFWNTVYENGLGEFFYRNEIDFRGLIHFPGSPAPQLPSSPLDSARGDKHRTLVPIGGGKDSLVTIEKLRAEGRDITLLRVGGHPLIDTLVEETGLPCITIKRSLDPQLFALNAQGALNGHVPITAYISCLCAVVAELCSFREIAFSNEKSASEGNVEYLGKEINHQWSKSEEFETMFQNYMHTYINPDLRYWSPLRSMTELEVVGEFVQYPQYFEHFTSCNKNWKIAEETPKQKWCCDCPKCAFAYALLAAYLPPEKTLSIFGEDLFAKESLHPLFRQLLGTEGFKPFECVGTPEETQEAFRMAENKGHILPQSLTTSP